MIKKFDKIVKATLAVAFGAMALAVLYQGCGNMDSASTASNMCIAGSGTAPIDKNYTVVPGQQTVSITYGRQTLDSMVACLGLGTPSTRALTEWQTRDQALSEYGNATDLSGAMLMAITAVAGEVCRDLVDKETALATGSRSFFGNINFAGTSSLAATNIEPAVNLLALSCWQRPATPTELQLFDSSIIGLNTTPDIGALSLCTAILSSLSGIMQ